MPLITGESNYPQQQAKIDDFDIMNLRGTQREYSSKPLKHSIVKRILVFKRQI